MEHILIQAISEGFTSFCLNYLSEMIESYFGIAKMGVKIKYIHEE